MCDDTPAPATETPDTDASAGAAAPFRPDREALTAPVPVRMANTMIDRMAATGACTIRDLLEADFTSEEIIEHQAEARSLAMARATRRLDADNVADAAAA